jgi:hypothetical protein
MGETAQKKINVPVGLLEAMAGKRCITWDTVAFVMWRRRVPWRWPRAIPKWFVEMKLEERRKKMLTVTGTADFVNEGRTLVATIVIQPHVPYEHELLERVANSFPESLREQIRMEKGNLVVSEKFDVPELEVPSPQEAPEAESAPESVATSASDGKKIREIGRIVGFTCSICAYPGPEKSYVTVAEMEAHLLEMHPDAESIAHAVFQDDSANDSGTVIEQPPAIEQQEAPEHHEGILHKIEHELEKVGEGALEVGAEIIAPGMPK